MFHLPISQIPIVANVLEERVHTIYHRRCNEPHSRPQSVVSSIHTQRCLVYYRKNVLEAVREMRYGVAGVKKAAEAL